RSGEQKQEAGRRNEDDVVPEQGRIHSMIAGDAPDETFRGAETAQVNRDVRYRGDRDEQAELVHTEETGKDSEGQELGCGADDEAGAGCRIRGDQRQGNAVAGQSGSYVGHVVSQPAADTGSGSAE